MEDKRTKKYPFGMSAKLYRLNIGMALALLVISALTATVLWIRAMDITGAQDTMSNQSVGGLSTHRISFNLSGGNEFSAGELVIIDFPPEFTPGGSWEASDFTFIDSLARDIVTVNQGAGVTTVTCAQDGNNVGIAVDTDENTFRIIPCSDGGGTPFSPSAAGAPVSFTINGATPLGTLANPAVAGTYSVTITDAAGDCDQGCQMSVSIVDAGFVSVSARVPGTCGNNIVEPGELCDDGNVLSGDGCSSTCRIEGSPPPTDITPPVIDYHCAIDIRETAATISWDTNEFADSLVRCGKEPGVYTILKTEAIFLLEHRIELVNLDPATAYYCQVCSKDSAHNNSCSAECSFSTRDERPPIISDLRCVDATETSFVIRWTTNEVSTSSIDYGLLAGPPYTLTTGDPTMVVDHAVTVGGLNRATLYHYRVRSSDAAGNGALTLDATCSTSGGAPPIISNVRATDVGCYSAMIRWDTNVGADSIVDFGLAVGPPYSRSVSDPGIVLEHVLTLPDLLPGTTYNYRPRSRDIVGREAIAPNQTFVTTGAGSLLISEVLASEITATSATISWLTNRNANSAVDYGLTTRYGATAADPSMVMGHSIALSGLQACTEYQFRLRSIDLCAESQTSTGHRFTTGAQAAPLISGVQVSMFGENSARITWNTTTPTSSIVDFGTTLAYGQTASDEVLTLNHLLVVNGLRPGTTYHFRVRSSDICRQEAVSGDGVFVTVVDNDPPGCALNLVAVAGDARAFLSWENPTDADLVGAVVVRRTGRCPVGPADGTVVYDGSETTYENLGLVNGLTYCYAVFPYDDARNFGCGATASVTPVGVPDVTPPACPSSFRATPGNRQVLLNWSNPLDPDFAGVRIKRGSGGVCPANEREGTTIYEGSGNNWLDATVSNDVTYCYALFSFDGSRNFCGGVSVEARPTTPGDVVPPACASGVVITPGDGQLLLTWENPTDGDWVGTRIVRRTDRFPVDPADGVVVFDGRDDHVLDGGLTNGTTYYYGVFSHDEVPNYCLGITARGVPQEGAVPPVLACTDTDGGQNFFLRGTVILNDDLQYIDACLNKEVLRENYCLASNLATIDYRCGVGYKCSLGRCVPDVFEPPIQQCGNGICEQPDCDIDCGEMTYDLYIINPDGNERHMGTDYVRLAELEPNLNIVGFEDKGEDWDYNDVEFRLDTRDCGRIVVTLISHNATWNHQVRLRVMYRDAPKLDRLVWHDSLVGIGDSVYLNVTDDPAICSGTENSINCPTDCPPLAPLPEVEENITVSAGEHIAIGRLRFYATKGRMPLVVTDDTVDVYPTMAVTTVLPFGELPKTAKTAYFNFGGATQVMLRATEGYEAKVITPEEVGLHPFAVIVEYLDGSIDIINGYFQVISFPRVIGEVDGRYTGVQDVRISLLVDLGEGNYGLWNGEPFGQSNPMMSRSNGDYGFIVQPGKYVVQAQKAGYRTKETMAFEVKNNLVTRDLQLVLQPEEGLLDMLLGQKLLQGLEVYTKYGAEVGLDNYFEFTDNPVVEENTERIAAPTLLAIAMANVMVAGAATATAAPYLLYLYSLLTHPSLLLGLRRRKKWGVVFNSITKQPIDLVIVRLIDERTNRIVRSTVTDKNGRYFFMVNNGSYRITVTKPGFVFPTIYLKSEVEDVRYIDLYHGETIAVSESTAITANIPIDPVISEKTPRRIVWEGIIRRIQRNISVVTIIAMAIAVIISPTPFVIGLFVANIVIYLIFRRLVKGSRPKSWGIVYDRRSRKPLRNAVVRVFEARYNKLLETRITDIRGRYAFLVGNNVYYVTYEKPGFQKKQTGPLDLVNVKKEEDQLIADDVGLDSVVTTGLWQAFREKLRSTFVTFGREKASVSKEPLADKIGKTGHLIAETSDFQKTGLAPDSVEPTSSTVVTKTTPWELRVEQQQHKSPTSEDTIKNTSTTIITATTEALPRSSLEQSTRRTSDNLQALSYDDEKFGDYPDKN
ncbi:hypothetical protein KKE28_04180 [Patescibacteria group bacterium]|nr:hypothetical protein [Patescibacteria group bacterium]